MVAFQKRMSVIRGKINMICKEWCMEMDQIMRHCWLFQRGSTVRHFRDILLKENLLFWFKFPLHLLLRAYNIGFNHEVLGLAENPARGTGFWSQNTKGVARGVSTEKARPEGWVFSQPQHPMIKAYYSMFLHCNTAITVFKLLAIVAWKRQRADISSRHCC